jgi:hypothetical protein
MNKNYNSCIYACKKGYGCRFRTNSLDKGLVVEGLRVQGSIASRSRFNALANEPVEVRRSIASRLKGSMLRVQG